MKKKISVFLFVSLGIIGFLSAQKLPYNVLIKGDVHNASAVQSVRLYRWNGHNYAVCDSSKSGASFSLKTQISRPEVAFLEIGYAKAMPIFLSEETFIVSGDMRNSKTLMIRGGQDQVVYNRYGKQLEQFDSEMEDLERQREQAETQRRSSEMRRLEDRLRETAERRTEVVRKFALSYSYSLASSYIAKTIINYLTVEEVQRLLKAYESQNIQDACVDFIRARYDVIKNIQVGKNAPDFSLPTNEGEMVPLSSFKGKFVLIDFWASWCYPCRKEMHNTVALYKQFKDRNFTIFGVSLDTDKARWLKAVKEDQMPWVQVRDIQGDRGYVAELYALGTFPQNILIDPQGVILAKNLSPDELSILLSKLLTASKGQ